MRRKKQEKTSLPAPQMPWQTGDFKRHATFRFALPYQFLLLCKTVQVTPREMLNDFMEHLACSNWNREGTEKASSLLMEYFIEKGYGRARFTEASLREMFQELNAVSIVWPKEAPMAFIDLSSQWRKNYYEYWVEKWRKNVEL